MIGFGGERLMARYPESIDDLPPPRRRGWWRRIWTALAGLFRDGADGDARYRRAVALCRDYRSERTGRRAVEAIQRDRRLLLVLGRARHGARSPRIARGRPPYHLAVGQAVPLRPAAAIDARRPINAISKDGVSVRAQISVRYQLLHNSVAVLHKFIGPELSELGRQSGNRQPGAAGHFRIHRAGGLYVARDHPEANPRQRAKEPRVQSQQIGAARGDGAARPQALQRLPAGRDSDPRYAGTEHRIAGRYRGGDQPPDRAVLHDPGIQIPGGSAKPRNPNANRSRPTASPHSRRPSARAFRTPICAGAASRRRCSWRSRRIRRSWSSARARTACRSFSAMSIHRR